MDSTTRKFLFLVAVSIAASLITDEIRRRWRA